MIETASPLQFMAGTVVRRDLAFIAAQIIALNQQGIDHTKVLRWKDGAWAHYMIDWPAIRLLNEQTDALTVYALYPFGRVHVVKGRERSIEEIDESREGPANRGVIRDMQLIGGMVHAVGMQRQAYRRLGPGRWERFDQETALPLKSSLVRSFDSVDGFSPNDIYTAGLEGEIWHWNGHWRALDSPSSVGFEKVLCVASTGVVFIGGQLGTLLTGRGDQWEVVDSGSIRETIRDLAWFRGRLFVSTAAALHVLEDGRLVRLDTGLGDSFRFGNLAAHDDVLWSIGRSRLAMTTDGVSWTEVVCTDASY